MEKKTNDVGKTGQPHATTTTTKNETRPLSHPIHKNQLKCIKDLNVRPETIKLLEENIGILLFEISLGNYFLLTSPQARETKAKINK